MEFKDVVGVGQAGLSAVIEEVAKVRNVDADELAERADGALSGPEHAVAEAGHAVVDAGHAAAGHVKDLATAALSLAAPAVVSHRKGRKALVTVAVIGAAAGAGYLMWKRRSRSIEAELSGESQFAAPVVPFQPGTADVDSPDVVDEQFAREIDEVAHELAEEIVESIEVPSEAAEAVETGEFQPGMADLDSPDVRDEQFAREVDQAADEIAEDIVEAIEQPRQ